MITHEYDVGWGPDVPLKQFERRLLDSFLARWRQDASNTVLINSIWYGTDYHQQVLEELRTRRPDRVVLVSMLDFAIPRAEWFTSSLDCPIVEVGYYPGPGEIDCWALIVNDFMREATTDMLAVDGIDTAYMCLNRKPHHHRVTLYEQLEAMALLDQGMVSLGGDNSPARRVIPNDQGHSDLAPNAGKQQHGIANDIASLGNPINWRRCFLNVVTETVFDINHYYFVSEKIYKPMVGERPFLVYAKDGATKWLADHGFENYCGDFSDITELDLSQPTNIAPFLAALVSQGTNYWKAKAVALMPKIQYNKARFYQYVTDTKNRIQQGISCQT